jgi:hypothetical protein
MKEREIVASDLQRSGFTQRLIPVGWLTVDVMARRGANIYSDHMLVVIKLRARICRRI